MTVNDYLARRDAQWMGRSTTGWACRSASTCRRCRGSEDKQAAYRADITYGTNNEYGFDYLRDNMVCEAQDRVQRGLNYAIVDEVDSIPDRRGAHAADHQRPGRGPHRDLPGDRNSWCRTWCARRSEDPRTGEGVTKPGDFTVDEKAARST